ncbi:MAG: hypothetical protein A2149_03385 [Candidatus Schekmanbacteria bacterium RBG_16_38_11]|uniref:Uncharacterized protein n=1 Tax=Candidatus Schekmanbacteria bacterium RBG_16_38_11 TaxID=1817880 RepID=A0A1F7S0Z1_9BACT|nr:MAG: hypothetical protein A2149_03385 [Candidatus Schekmanbacteria bacterium RBG_16_38_11]
MMDKIDVGFHKFPPGFNAVICILFLFQDVTEDNMILLDKLRVKKISNYYEDFGTCSVKN